MYLSKNNYKYKHLLFKYILSSFADMKYNTKLITICQYKQFVLKMQQNTLKNNNLTLFLIPFKS